MKRTTFKPPRNPPAPSRLSLMRECRFPISSGIPWPKFRRGVGAQFGVAVHHALECYGVMGKVDCNAVAEAYGLTTDSERRSLKAHVAHGCAVLDDDAATFRACEIKVQFNVHASTGRTVQTFDEGETVDNAADMMRASLQRGAIDVVTQSEGQPLTVRDWKTGRYALDIDPATDLQMQCYALATAWAFKVPEVRVEIVCLSDDGARTRAAHFDAAAIKEIAGQASWLLANIGAPAPPQPGPHCKSYCPIAASCPVTLANVQALESGAFKLDFHDDAQAADAYNTVKRVRLACDQVMSAVNARAEERLLPIGNGKALGMREQTTESVVTSDKVIDVLMSRGLYDAVTTSVSKTALWDALRTAKEEGVSLAQAKRDLLAELQAVDGLKTTTSKRLKEIKL